MNFKVYFILLSRDQCKGAMITSLQEIPADMLAPNPKSLNGEMTSSDRPWVIVQFYLRQTRMKNKTPVEHEVKPCFIHALMQNVA